MTSSALSSIAVFGTRQSVWPVAAMLAQNLPDRIALTVVEDVSSGGRFPALSMKVASRFHDQLGINAHALVEHCGGRFGLGHDLVDWQGEGSRNFVAASGTLPKINGVAVHQIMLRAAMMNNEPEKLAYLIQPFRFAARAAMEGKLSLASDDPSSPLSLLGPTVQIDADGYAAYLSNLASGESANRLEGRPARILQSEDGAETRKVILDDGQEIEADLFIDTDGTLSALSLDAAAGQLEMPEALLPFDRIGTTRVPPGEIRHVRTRALAGGVVIETALANEIDVALLYSADVMDETAVHRIAGANMTPESFTFDALERPWSGNLARIGTASANLGPLFSADIMLMQEQAMQLVRCIPATRDMAIEATEFNRKHASLFSQLRDFAILPFALNQRSDPLWSAMRECALPDTLQTRLDQFRSRGRLVTFDNEIFDEQTWIETMIEFGIVPERYDPLADMFDMKQIVPVLRNLVDGFNRTIASMPDAS
ncbi:tryptophan 7-halogenase [Parasphingopyxis sp. CP4]|uniref:tryptophan 7-halogenase n=1 Tax=Parasphingopyxis sp. CP4 TaxID=2724527 RepID=UPI0015A0EF0D|nr:tryptophan 7-halogenase [Parasphingopyxis sp. CP4]QLC21187.1 tryptophan 7-halogenase [Parasphingopyxis sp. CP4]